MIKAKEKPIIFSTLLIPAIQNLKPNTWPPEPIDPGKPWKWQTRRIIKPQPHAGIRKKPPYQPGNMLWVREPWARISDWTEVDPDVGLNDGYIYSADWHDTEHPEWRPSIHMPKEAARLFLEVKNVRVERLQTITEEDATAEGMSKTLVDGVTFISAKGKFHALWDTLYAKRGHPWENNPWVWVYEFMRTEVSAP